MNSKVTSTYTSLHNSLIISHQTKVIKLIASSTLKLQTLTQVIKLIDLNSSPKSQVLIKSHKLSHIDRNIPVNSVTSL